MKWLLLTLAALLSVAAVVNVLRTPAPQSPEVAEAFLARMDTDGSGSVSPDEYRRVSDGIVDFTVFDTDSSGALEPWEVELVLHRISPDTPQPTHLPRVR